MADYKDVAIRQLNRTRNVIQGIETDLLNFDESFARRSIPTGGVKTALKGAKLLLRGLERMLFDLGRSSKSTPMYPAVPTKANNAEITDAIAEARGHLTMAVEYMPRWSRKLGNMDTPASIHAAREIDKALRLVQRANNILLQAERDARRGF